MLNRPFLSRNIFDSTVMLREIWLECPITAMLLEGQMDFHSANRAVCLRHYTPRWDTRDGTKMVGCDTLEKVMESRVGVRFSSQNRKKRDSTWCMFTLPKRRHIRHTLHPAMLTSCCGCCLIAFDNLRITRCLRSVGGITSLPSFFYSPYRCIYESKSKWSAVSFRELRWEPKGQRVEEERSKTE